MLSRQRAGLAAALILAGTTPARAGSSSNAVVEVHAGRLMPPGRSDSVATAFERDPRVLLNRQGGADVQADISIRGSSFSAVGLTVEGVALRHPQTEHFHAELPVPASVFSDPTVLTGLGQVKRSMVHPVGAVAFDVRDPENSGYVDLGLGEAGSAWQAAYLERLLPSSPAATVGLSGFAHHERSYGVDYADNDLKRVGGGLALKTRRGAWATDWIAGATRKEFGARGYYGVNPDWAAIEELEDTMVLGSIRHGDKAGRTRRITAMWRGTRDEYRLFINPQDPYRNRHRARMSTVAWDGRERVGEELSVLWRGAYAYEGVDSSNLGDHDRERLTALVLPTWVHGQLSVSAGMTVERYSDGTAAGLPQGGLEWQLADGQVLFVTYTEAMQEPSYTELNYESPGSLGNSGLEKGRTKGVECGWHTGTRRGVSGAVSLFYRAVDHSVDWIKQTETSARWAATDLGSVGTWGAECSGGRKIGEQFRVRAAYTWLEKDHAWDVYGARYVLDYPTHRLSVDLDWMFAPDWRLTLGQDFRYHGETQAREADATGSDGRLALQWMAGTPDGLVVRAGIDNLWNDTFGSYVDLPPPDRRAWIAAAWRFR